MAIFYTKRTVTNNATYLTALPDVDMLRAIAIYIRQSAKDADDRNGESRATQLSLINLALKLRKVEHVFDDLEEVLRLVKQTGKPEIYPGVRVYDEGAGMSGQKRIDQRPKLDMLYRDMEAGAICVIICAREDRLFRDKWGIQSGTFMELAERKKVNVLVPPLSLNSRMRFYDFSNYENVKAFKEKMQAAYDYIETHVRYMLDNRRNKGNRGNYDGRSLPPGYAVPKNQEKMEQKIAIYEPWASVMEELFNKWEAYDYSLARIIRYIESLPFLFKDIPAEDMGKYTFKTSVKKVEGGYKPSDPGTIAQWFKNVLYIGWWPTSQQGEVIADNHPALFDVERFEKGHISMTGYSLEGVKVAMVHHPRRHQARRYGTVEHEALLTPVLSNPVSSSIYVNEMQGVEKYRFLRKGEGRLTTTLGFNVACAELDKIVIDRIRFLAEGDKEMAQKIEQSIKDVKQQKDNEVVSIVDQLKQIELTIAKLNKRLITVSSVIDEDDFKDEQDNPIFVIAQQIRELSAQKGELEKKKSMVNGGFTGDEIRKFYSVLDNFLEEWPQLTKDQKKKFFKLTTKKLVVESVSPHWLKITIVWLSPICARPDIAYVWRLYPERQTYLEDWEINILKEQFATEEREKILQQMPSRTWGTIRTYANRDFGLKRTAPQKKERFSPYIAWDDLTYFPDMEKAIAMANEGVEYCKQGKGMYIKWLIGSNEQFEELVEWVYNNDIKGGQSGLYR